MPPLRYHMSIVPRFRALPGTLPGLIRSLSFASQPQVFVLALPSRKSCRDRRGAGEAGGELLLALTLAAEQNGVLGAGERSIRGYGRRAL